MELNSLTAISPIDGRYRRRVQQLAPYFSEFALIKYRVLVEVEYIIALAESGASPLADFPKEIFPQLRLIYENFSQEDALTIKRTERTTNHDVKAVEYFVKEKMAGLQLDKYLEFIHFGLTSQDINNTAYPLMVKEAVEKVYIPSLDEVLDQLKAYAEEWKDIAMLARTHGQPATPTKLGKEIYVFYERLNVQLAQMKNIPYSAKFGGATGGLNAHVLAFPEIDWRSFADSFVKNNLGLTRSKTTTQIEHYDNLAALFDAMARINTILLDLSRDMWTYISMEYFKQKLKKDEIGSSAMPHKVNPIDFENAEGNIGIAGALFHHFSSKLPVSRLQRDLSDSTVLRNLGVPIAHSVIAFGSVATGLKKLLLNETAIHRDLEDNWAVVAEAIQTILRREGFPKPYEALKELTRVNTKISKSTVHDFIDTLAVTDSVKEELKTITPFNYTGY